VKPDGLASKILGTSLICLSEGNASYVVWHIAPSSVMRDLEFTVPNSGTNEDGVFTTLKKCQLEFEVDGIDLGWRVMGVRWANAPNKYRGTFLLDRPNSYWPWFYDWKYPIGSIPAPSSLLNFDPPWPARKPYTCAICYSSDHAVYKCPLPNLRIGGAMLVSAMSVALVSDKKAQERIIVPDRSLNPRVKENPAAAPTNAPAVIPPPPSKPMTDNPCQWTISPPLLKKAPALEATSSRTCLQSLLCECLR